MYNEDENFNLEEALDKAVQNLSTDIGSFQREESSLDDVISADPNIRNYTYTFIGDKLYYRENAVKGMGSFSVSATETYGTKRINAYYIVEETLNLRTVTVKDRIEDGDSVRYVINQRETMLGR